MALVFDESLKTGITDIDIQHNFLFEAINSLENISLLESNDDMWLTLCKIEQFTQNHFKTEENYMLKYKYPDTQEHITQHNSFLDKYTLLKKDFEEEGLSENYLINLRMFLSGWIIDHYTNTDVKMAEFLRSFL